jgi:hypothetical protein
MFRVLQACRMGVHFPPLSVVKKKTDVLRGKIV